MDSVQAAGQNQQSVVFLVEGGPGTGKSVIAVNLVAELSALGLRTLHLTGSKAFTENLRKIVGTRAGAHVQVLPRHAPRVDEPLDVAILDEAHRIRTISTSRFTPAKARTGKAQIDDILDSSRVSVFFIDDLQVVRPGEVGSTDLIRESAAKRVDRGPRVQARGAVPLERLGLVHPAGSTTRSSSPGRRRSSGRWTTSSTSGSSLGPRARAADPDRERRKGRPRDSSPASAGPGPTPTTTGELVPDVRVGEWSMPWNAQAGAGKLGPGIPKSDFWASAEEGIDQVGCVYTAQGFEFDYVGVIFGPDLVYRPMDGGWVGQREGVPRPRRQPRRHRRPSSPRFVKSTYRVLLTRGLRGCYVYFMDGPTRDFFVSRTERVTAEQRRAAERPEVYEA